MDLVAGVRKEGSRGGRDSFKWSDVQQSQHRENYLGHSLMAPVGRWQNGRDLQWYAKAEDKDAEKARTEREEELRRVKEAEEEAMARALGLPVPPRSTNANLTPLGSKDVQKAIQETAGGDAEDGGKGIGFGSYGGRASGARLGPEADKLEGVGLDERPSRRDRRDRSRSPERRRDRSRDRNRERERRHHRHHHRDDREYHRHERRHRLRSLSRDRDYRRKSESRERSKEGRRADAYDKYRRSGRDHSPDNRGSHRRSGRDRSHSRRH